MSPRLWAYSTSLLLFSKSLFLVFLRYSWMICRLLIELLSTHFRTDFEVLGRAGEETPTSSIPGHIRWDTLFVPLFVPWQGGYGGTVKMALSAKGWFYFTSTLSSNIITVNNIQQIFYPDILNILYTCNWPFADSNPQQSSGRVMNVQYAVQCTQTFHFLSDYAFIFYIPSSSDNTCICWKLEQQTILKDTET